MIARLGRLLLALLTAAMSLSAAPSFSAHLASLRWDQRVILITGESPPGPATILAQAPALKDYRLHVFFLGENAARQLYPTGPEASFPVSAEERPRWFSNAAPGSVLIGLDGGVKERQVGPVEWESYYGAIERMPMRRAEKRAP